MKTLTILLAAAGILAFCLTPAVAETHQTAARDALQKGWGLHLRFNAEDNAKAIPHLKKAVELDPEYGRAYAALGLAYLRSVYFYWGAPLGMSNPHAKHVASRYLEQAKKYPTALGHAALSLLHLLHGRQGDALNEAARAISLDPNEPEAHIAMAWVLIPEGKPDEALKFIEAAMWLNPNYPSHYVMARGMAYFAKADFELVTSEFRARLEQEPQAKDLAPSLASAYALLGRREQARAALQVWKPTLSQLELSNIPKAFLARFTRSWSYEVRQPLFDGMHIAALPLGVTVPRLVATVKGDNPIARLSAMKTLGRFGPMAEPAVPTLIAALDDEEEIVREGAALALAKIGPRAKDAIPAL